MLLYLFVNVPRGLAQRVADLVLGLVVSDVGPSSRLRVLADQSYSRGGFAADHLQYVDDDHPLVVFGAGGHVAGDVFPNQVSEHLVALCVLCKRVSE